MKLRKKTIFDITAGDVVKIIVLYKISKFTYKVLDRTAQKLYERHEDEISEWVDKTSTKIADKTTDVVFPPQE